MHCRSCRAAEVRSLATCCTSLVSDQQRRSCCLPDAHVQLKAASDWQLLVCVCVCVIACACRQAWQLLLIDKMWLHSGLAAAAVKHMAMLATNCCFVKL